MITEGTVFEDAHRFQRETLGEFQEKRMGVGFEIKSFFETIGMRLCNWSDFRSCLGNLNTEEFFYTRLQGKFDFFG